MTDRVAALEERIRNVARTSFLEALLQLERSDGGMVAVGVAVEGTLDAIGIFLRERIGSAAAYETLQRSCDGIAHRVADELIVKPEGE